MRFFLGRTGAAAAIVVALLALGAGEADQRQAEQKTLSQLQSFIGNWKGGGQIRRGSSDGAWVEESDWAWKFTDKSASLTFTSQKAKYIRGGTLKVGAAAGEFALITQAAADGAETHYTGKLQEDGQLVFATTKSAAGQPDRISLRTLAEGNRLVVLYEKKSTISDRLTRLAEVGYTRVGSGFGKGSNGPECVVTGGVGTIAVTHKGQTYYVCCAGCKDIFNEAPDKVLAEYKARKEKEKEAGKK